LGSISKDESKFLKNDLSDKEVDKNHSIRSYQLLKTFGYEEKLLKIVAFHHERSDGSGYPFGIKDNKIPLLSKILSIADEFDSAISKRGTRRDIFKMLENFYKENLCKLDLKLLDIFVKKTLNFLKGKRVVLSNGEKGKIIEFNSFEIFRPVILLDSSRVFDASKNRNVEIINF